MSAPLALLAATLVVVFALALRARRGVGMSLEQWSIGGRGFSALLVFVLIAGELYTTFTFLGASGFAYGFGGAALYIVVYTTQAFVLSYWLLPAIWRYAKTHRLLTQADLFAKQYDSPFVGLLVAAISLVALLPYLALQLKGLGILVETSSYGVIPTGVAIWIGAAALAGFVVVSGVHGSALTAIVKDAVVLSVCVFLGVYLPCHYYGSLTGMFHAIDAQRPDFFTLPAAGKNLTWYLSTIVVCALGMFMWPHTFSSVYTAKSDDHFRRNAAVMPLYALVMLFSMFVGFAAVLQIPGLQGPRIDLALLALSIRSFDPWFVGVIGAAGLLTALVPASIMLVSVATLFARNIYPVSMLRPGERQLAQIAKLAALVLTMAAVVIALHGGQSIVALLIMGYSLVSQVLPSLFAGLLRNNPVNKYGASAGMIAGVATVATLVLTNSSIATVMPSQAWAATLNPGIVAWTLNVATMLVVSGLTKRRVSNALA